MGADMHAADASQMDYLDDQRAFLAEHGHEPGIDVTLLRDHEAVPEHIKQMLYHDMAPDEALVLADALELHASRALGEEPVPSRMAEAADWLRYWAGSEKSGVDGIH